MPPIHVAISRIVSLLTERFVNVLLQVYEDSMADCMSYLTKLVYIWLHVLVNPKWA